MKKFFSLFCAMAIVLTVGAVSFEGLKVPAGKVKKELRYEKVALKDAKATLNASKNVVKKAEKARVATKAPLAKKEAFSYDLSAENAEIEWADHCATGGWWQIQAENSEVYFSISNLSRETAEGTYSWADLDPEYCGYWVSGMEAAVNFVDGSCTVAIDESDGYQVVVSGSFTAENGDIFNVNITYYEAPAAPILPGDYTFAAVSKSEKFYAEDNDVYIRFTDNDGNTMLFDIVVEEGTDELALNTTYTLSDMLANYSRVSFDGANSPFISASFEKTADATSETYTATAADTLGRIFHLSYTFVIPVAESSETIVATNLELDDSYASYLGIIFAEASNENYAVSMSFSGESASAIVGTHDATTLGLQITDADDNKIAIYSGSVTVAVSNGGYVITGTILGENSVEYTLNLSYVAPEATSQENVNLSGSITNYGSAWQFMGESGSFFVSVAAFSATIPGTYGRADLAADYTYVAKFVGADTLYYDMVDANIVVAVSGDNATITGSLKGQNEDDAADIIEFILNLTANVEEAQEQGDPNDAQNEAFEYDFSEYSIDDQYLAQYNVLIVEAQNADGSYISIEFNLPAGVTELAAGEYPISASYEENTVSAGSLDGYIYGSFAGFILESGDIAVPLWLFNEGSVTVHESGVIVVNATNTWGVEIHSQLGSWPSAVENTDAAVKASKLVRNGQLMIIRNGVEYNAQGAVVK